jgi:hypothetical protein
MPANVVKTERDEHLWEKAKGLAKNAGKDKDYAYIMGIFKKMKGLEKSCDNMRKAEKIPGGLGQGKTAADFDPEQLADGIAEEMEHTTDPAIAEEIAIDHLTEDENYYKKLKKIEKSFLSYDDFRKARVPVGEIREWRGGKFKKVAEGKWTPVKEGEKTTRPDKPKLKITKPSGGRKMPGKGPTWTKHEKGYTIEHKGQKAELVRDGKEWSIKHNGKKHSMPKRATFDHAEGALTALGFYKEDKEMEKALVKSKTPPKEYREEGATERSDYADPKNYKYPLHTEHNVRAAISYFSQPKNANVYSVSEQKKIWGRIKSAAKKHKIEVSEQSGPPSVEKSMEKSVTHDLDEWLTKSEQMGLFDKKGAVKKKEPSGSSGGAKPPGAGWQVIPGGKKGGYRRKSVSGKGWDYWYEDMDRKHQTASQYHADKVKKLPNQSDAAYKHAHAADAHDRARAAQGKEGYEIAADRAGKMSEIAEQKETAEKENKKPKTEDKVEYHHKKMQSHWKLAYKHPEGSEKREAHEKAAMAHGDAKAAHRYGHEMKDRASKRAEEMSQATKGAKPTRKKQTSEKKRLPQSASDLISLASGSHPLDIRYISNSQKKHVDTLINAKWLERVDNNTVRATSEGKENRFGKNWPPEKKEIKKSMPKSEIMMFGSVPIVMGGMDLEIEQEMEDGLAIGTTAQHFSKPSLRKGVIYQGESVCLAGGDNREENARASLSAEIQVLDEAGTDGNGGLPEWWKDAERINHAERLPLNYGLYKSAEPETKIIDDSDPYVRRLQLMSTQDGQANVNMAYNGEHPDRIKR